jgi:peptide/nickel transport system substrate-binding protein
MPLKLTLHYLLLPTVFLLAACSSSPQPDQTTPQHTLIYGLTFLPSGIDPHINAEAEIGIPLRQVYDTLVYRDPKTKEFVPGLATAWNISEDGLSYTFNLRQGVTFHDGTIFNAQAVGANLDRIVDPNTGSQKALALLGSYTGYDVLDDYTIRLHLNSPYEPLLDSLSQVYLGIASPTALAQYSRNRYQFHQVGTGPYVFVEYVPGDRIVLRRNPSYNWEPPFYTPPNQDTIDEIDFRFFTNSSRRSQTVANGDAQVIDDILPNDARALTGNAAVQVIPVNIAGQPLQFMMNIKRFPTDNLSVRQALLFATNRNEIIDTVFQRFSPVAWGPLSANALYYSRDMNGLYAQDIVQAQSLLTSAGYQDTNNDGYLDIGGIDLEVKILVSPSGQIPDVAQQLQEQWRTVGIKVTLEPIPTLTALKETVATNEYNLVAMNDFGVDPVLLDDYFMTDGAYNWSRFSSPELDNILSQAVAQHDPNTRRNLYAQAQQIIMQNALILPIRDYVNLNAVSTAIQGMSFDAFGWFPILSNVGFQQ